MSEPIRLQRDGQRIYFSGDTYAAKDRIKALGGHWDGERRQWWVGAAKAREAERLVAELAIGHGPAPAKSEDPDQIRLVGKATYKGRTYYVRALSQDGRRARLVSLDAAVDFWAEVGSDEGQATIAGEEQPMRHDYLGALSSAPSYDTPYRRFCSALAEAEPEWATVEQLDAARHAVASRRDRLVGRDRGRHAPGRAAEAERLGNVYRDLMARLLARGWC